MANSYPSVYIVVLNWNGFEDTEMCLRSLWKLSYPNVQILVVDNGSTDSSPEKLRQMIASRSNATLLINNSNLGFSRGCNVGIRHALTNRADYILLLNNDATLVPNAIQSAVQVAQSDDRIGLIGGKIYLRENMSLTDSRRLWYAGGTIDLWRGRVTIRGFRERDSGQYDLPGETGFITGAMMFIPRKTIETIGMLPEEYFFGTEERDYSYQVLKNQYKLYYVPSFCAYHKADGSHSNSDPIFVYNNYRSKLLFQKKYFPKLLWPLWLFAFFVYQHSVARQRLARLHENGVDIDHLLFAVNRAFADHLRLGLAPVTSCDLERFQAKLRMRCNRAKAL